MRIVVVAIAGLVVVACVWVAWAPQLFGLVAREAVVERSATQVRRFHVLTGYPNGRPGYVVDHLIPLACGGPDHPVNMQWQPIEEAKAKDRVELQCERYCPPFNRRVRE